jgi:hypothetical protein
MISDLIGNTNNPVSNILINLFDFDTGLTRYDIHHLSQKSEYWEKRMKEVLAIQDPQQREVENQKLVAEMMQDPAMKKIVKKLFAFGTKSALSILEAIKGF